MLSRCYFSYVKKEKTHTLQYIVIYLQENVKNIWITVSRKIMDKVDLSHREEQMKCELQNAGTCGRTDNGNKASLASSIYFCVCFL